MNNILVTGGAGFIGSNLCERLVKDGHNVTSLDNYFTGTPKNHVDGVTYITGSTPNIHTLDWKFKTPDIIFHLGEYSRVEQSFDDFDRVWDYNIIGTKAVLEYARYTGAKLIYAGSSTKFADNSHGYVQSPYAWSKESNTKFVMKWCQWHDMDYAITYFYNVYGPRELSLGKYSTVIAKYAELISNGHKKLPVVLPGSQVRNFTHVDDIVDGLILIAEYGHGDEYGIGHPDEYSVLDVVKMFGAEPHMMPERKGNRMSAAVLSMKTRNLGWSPKKNLPDYIKQLLK